MRYTETMDDDEWVRPDERGFRRFTPEMAPKKLRDICEYAERRGLQVWTDGKRLEAVLYERAHAGDGFWLVAWSARHEPYLLMNFIDRRVHDERELFC